MVLPDRQASPAICVVYTAALCVFNIACLCFQAGKQPCIQAFHIAAMEMGRYMDSLIADNKSKEAQEKRQKEEHQAAMNALYTSQGALFTSGSSLVTEHMQLPEREGSLAAGGGFAAQTGGGIGENEERRIRASGQGIQGKWTKEKHCASTTMT
eukprot:scaffold201198_cov23-Tisochrysis_lutea.AAC.1